MSIAIRLRTDVRPERGPVPANVSGEFVVYLGTDDVAESLDVATAELLLTWIEWVEVEVIDISQAVSLGSQSEAGGQPRLYRSPCCL